ncbi:MAG: hypothetical protein ACLSA6_04100 [Holdemania massiliensis]
MGQRFYQQVLALEVQSQDIIERLRQEQENRRLLRFDCTSLSANTSCRH